MRRRIKKTKYVEEQESDTEGKKNNKWTKRRWRRRKQKSIHVTSKSAFIRKHRFREDPHSDDFGLEELKH
jgi:hypothetical protein